MICQIKESDHSQPESDENNHPATIKIPIRLFFGQYTE